MINNIDESETLMGDFEKIPKYITDFVCTYNKMGDSDDSLIMYQIQLLQAFDLLEYNDDIINKTTHELYEKFKDNSYIINIIKSNREYLDDELLLFRLCFRYDTFYLFHSIISSLINNKTINEEYYTQILSI